VAAILYASATREFREIAARQTGDKPLAKRFISELFYIFVNGNWVDTRWQ
jgi:hypothetical protein